MPKLGLGTWRMKGDDCREAVERALSLGYRHLDTAEMYGNEEAVGAALAGARLPRADIHVTTKVWWEHLAPDALRQALRNQPDQAAIRLRRPLHDPLALARHGPAGRAGNA